MLGHFSCIRLFATPWTVAHQAPLSMGFSYICRPNDTHKVSPPEISVYSHLPL